MLLVLLLNDTSMFSGENYWTADFVLVGVSLVLVLMLGGRSIFDFFEDAWRVCSSGGRAVVRGEVSRRGQVAPKPGQGGEVEVAQGAPAPASNGSSGVASAVKGQQEPSVSSAPANMDLQAALRTLAEQRSMIANKDAELANKDAELARLHSQLETLTNNMAASTAANSQPQKVVAKQGIGQAGLQLYAPAQLPSSNTQMQQSQARNRQQSFVIVNAAGETETHHRNGMIDIVTPSGRHFQED